MKERPDLNKLSKEVYEANKLKGFHDENKSDKVYLMLIVTELSEAVEADRKGFTADLPSFILLNDSSIKRTGNPQYFNKIAFGDKIKDTVEDELADAVIRPLDLMGLRNFKFSDSEIQRHKDYVKGSDLSFIEEVYYMAEIICSNINVSDKAHSIIALIESFCERMQIDLWLHVELKLKYNQTRPVKHGKKY